MRQDNLNMFKLDIQKNNANVLIRSTSSNLNGYSFSCRLTPLMNEHQKYVEFKTNKFMFLDEAKNFGKNIYKILKKRKKRIYLL